MIFNKNNAHAHKTVIAMGNLWDLRYDLPDHPCYSVDLAPSDFYFFLHRMNFVSGKNDNFRFFLSDSSDPSFRFSLAREY